MGVILCSAANEKAQRRAMFAKSAIDLANEPYLTVFVPASEHADKRAENLVGDMPELACVLLKKPQVYGCVGGVNEKMLCVGYNPLNTNLKSGGDGLSGYADLCRLMLQRCEDAKQALEFFKSFLEKYSPSELGRTDADRFGASFAIADRSEAFIAETAAEHWVIKRVEDFEAAACEPTISNEYDECSESVRALAKNNKPADFAAALSSKNVLSHGNTTIRRYMALAELFDAEKGKQKNTLSNLFLNTPTREEAEGIDFFSVHAAIAAHTKVGKPNEAPCTHASREKTAGSLIVDLDSGIVYAAPDCSLPCCSLYMPLSMKGDLSFLENEDAALDRWYTRETLVRNYICKQLDLKIVADNMEREQEALLARTPMLEDCTAEECGRLNRELFERADSFYKKAFDICKKKPPLFSFRATGESADYQSANAEFFSELPDFSQDE